jgi:hypothetical protein
MAKRFFAFPLAVPLVVFFLIPLFTPAPARAVARYDTAEVAVQSDLTYNGASGTPNPFTDVDFSAQVTAPSGRTYSVPGFFDGNGQGGSSGKVFKVRIFADEVGTWRWTTQSNQPSLHGKSGSFTCSGLLAGRFSAGPVEVDPDRPRTFRYRNGTPVYLLGKFLDADAPTRLRWSQTLLSEDSTDTDRRALLDRHLGMRLNKMSVYLANKGDYAHVSTTPWVGRDTNNDKTRFDLARWHMYERWVRELRGAGLLAHLWFFADDSQFGDLPEADRKRLIRYGMARLSGYANTLFTLALEWQEGWTSAEVADHMGYLHQNNPWDRLISVHGVPGHFSFPGEPWADYMQVQAGNQTDLQDVWTSTLVHRLLGEKPVIQEEHGLGQEDAANRRKAWAAFVGGSSGLGTGAFLEPLARFLPGTPFERMEPDDLVVLTGNAWALADRGRHYVFYLQDGGSITVDLLLAPGPFLAEWFDPRTGLFTPPTTVTGSRIRTFTAPGAGDWVLTLRLPPSSDGNGGSESSAPSDFYTLPPCRALDTREDGGVLLSGERRPHLLAGTCDIPPTARAVAVNLTTVAPTGAGYVTLWPGDTGLPLTSSINFGPGGARSNHTVLPVGRDGTLLVQPFVEGSGTAHVVVDVFGYFE